MSSQIWRVFVLMASLLSIKISYLPQIFEDDVLGVLKELHLSESYADVVFVVQGERIHAHRAILAARSEYFRGLLFGGLAEAELREINLDFELEPFKEMLLYIYTGRLSIAKKADDITRTLGLLKLADFLNLAKLVSDITKLVQLDLALDNVTAIFNFTVASHFDELTSVCLDLMDKKAVDYILHESFKTLSKVSLEKILQRDSFDAPEVEIFRAAMRWYEANPIAENKAVFRHIRLSAMEVDKIVNVVKPTRIFEDDELFLAIVARTQAKNLPYRHFMPKNEMIPLAPLSFDETRTVVIMAVTSSINHIHATLDADSFGYTAEVSRDNIRWEQVINHRGYKIGSTQDLYFEPRIVRYIKFDWVGNKYNVCLDRMTSYAMFSDDVPQLVNGIIAPIENVIDNAKATFDECIFREGSIIALDYDNCPSMIKFDQPYYIGSLRWSLQNNSNLGSFTISTSIDRVVWNPVYTGEGSQNWIHCTFEPHTFLFVRIKTPCPNLTFKLEMPSQDTAKQRRPLKRPNCDGTLEVERINKIKN